MNQKIASSTTHVSPDRQFGQYWETIRGRLWSAAMLAIQSIVSSIRSFRNPLKSRVSTAVNIDRISARLAVVDRAQADGRNELPRSTEEVVTGTQKEIVFYFKAQQKKVQQQIAALADRIRELGEDIDLSETVRNLRDIPSRCEHELLRLSANYHAEHDGLWEREAELQKHYEKFREENQLIRIAKYPSSRGVPYTVTAVLIIGGVVAFREIMAELNSVAIIPTSWILVTLILVALVPFVLARTMFRLVNVVGGAGQIAGLSGGIMAIAFIGALAIFVAHYVLIVAVNPETSLRNIGESIMQAPASVGSDMVALAGFGVVVLVGLAAFVVGYKSDDAYPGYGAIQRDFYRARDDRELYIKRTRERINMIVDKAETEVSRIRSRARAKISQFSKLVDESRHSPAALDNYNLALEDACNILLDRYRAANCDSRQSETPLSFSEHICFRSDEQEKSSKITDGERRRVELRKGISELEDEAARSRQKLRDLDWNAINQLEDNTKRGASLRDSDGDRLTR